MLMVWMIMLIAWVIIPLGFVTVILGVANVIVFIHQKIEKWIWNVVEWLDRPVEITNMTPDSGNYWILHYRWWFLTERASILLPHHSTFDVVDNIKSVHKMSISIVKLLIEAKYGDNLRKTVIRIINSNIKSIKNGGIDAEDIKAIAAVVRDM